MVQLPDGRFVTEFINCSYLGLDVHPAVIAGAKAVLDTWGVHFCCARSRFTIGPNGLLEEGLSKLFRGPAITFPSVSSAHLSVLPLLASGVLLTEAPQRYGVRLIFDHHAHASMQCLRPILATEGRVTVIAHSDLDALAKEARNARKHGEIPVYVADSVYSMGGPCPIKELLRLADNLGICLYLDDAHGTSVYGDHGEGWVLSQIDGPLPPNVYVAFSLAKGFGTNGGGIVVPGEREASLIRKYGQTYSFSGPLDFAIVGGALAALELHRDGTVADLQRTLRAKVALFDKEMGQSGPFSPIRMVHAGAAERCIQLGEELLSRGYFVTTAFFPVVPRGQAQLRLAITVGHEDKDIRGVAEAIRFLMSGSAVQGSRSTKDRTGPRRGKESQGMKQQTAAECYNQAVAANAAAHFTGIDDARARYQLERVPFLATPAFFDARDRPRIAQLLDRVNSAIEKVGEVYFSAGVLPSGEPLSCYIPLDDRSLALAHLDSSRGPRLGVSRYDAVADPQAGSLELLEINAGDPSGLAYHDACLEGLLNSPATFAVRRRFDIQVDHLLPSHRQALLEAVQRGKGGSAPPVLGFAVSKDSTVRDDHLAMAAAARAAGLSAHVGDPREFTYDGKSLRLEGQAIDVVWRDTIDEFARDPYWGQTEPFLTAYRENAFALRNPFCSAFADCKGVFAILSDERNEALFSPDEIDALRAHIPWSRVLREGKTTWENRDIDLVPFAKSMREQLVIKPNVGWGGYGILVGCECDPGSWEDRIEKALRAPGSDIVQRYHALPLASFPSRAGGCSSLPFVSSFWHFGKTWAGQFCGSLIRASDKRVINVHQGGGLSTIFWVEGVDGKEGTLLGRGH